MLSLNSPAVYPQPLSRRSCYPTRRFAAIQDNLFSLRDLGSAGGTFVRLESGVSTLLYPGMIIMLGRHQVHHPLFTAEERITHS